MRRLETITGRGFEFSVFTEMPTGPLVILIHPY